MPIQVGDQFPRVSVQTCDAQGAPAPLDLDLFLQGKTVVIVGVTGAFTPTCSVRHLPGFVQQAAALQAKGVDMIACHAVNDAFVLGTWAKSLGSADITMIADGTAALTRALGLELDLTATGMGLRCQRYAAIVKNGEVTYLGVEPGQSLGVSSAKAVLEAL